MQKNLEGRARRKRRIRKKVNGTESRPRLSVFRSSKHIYAQVVNDSDSKTVAAASSTAKGFSADSKLGAAKAVGEQVAKACLEKGISTVVFDRSGYRYHGRVRALADAAREAGLKF